MAHCQMDAPGGMATCASNQASAPCATIASTSACVEPSPPWLSRRAARSLVICSNPAAPAPQALRATVATAPMTNAPFKPPSASPTSCASIACKPASAMNLDRQIHPAAIGLRLYRLALDAGPHKSDLVLHAERFPSVVQSVTGLVHETWIQARGRLSSSPLGSAGSVCAPFPNGNLTRRHRCG